MHTPTKKPGDAWGRNVPKLIPVTVYSHKMSRSAELYRYHDACLQVKSSDLLGSDPRPRERRLRISGFGSRFWSYFSILCVLVGVWGQRYTVYVKPCLHIQHLSRVSAVGVWGETDGTSSKCMEASQLQTHSRPFKACSQTNWRKNNTQR
jgi:hypothetical protein